VKTNEEMPLTSDKIEKNINALNGKLKKNTSNLYTELVSGLKSQSVSELTWKDPLANQIISDDSNLVLGLSKEQRRLFMVKFFFFHMQLHIFFSNLNIILIYAIVRDQ
jgi:hypothetical protein